MEGGALQGPPDRLPDPRAVAPSTDDRAHLIPSASQTVPSQNGSGALDKMRSRLAEMAYTDPEKATRNHPGSYQNIASDTTNNRNRLLSDMSPKGRCTPLVVLLILCLTLLVGFALLSVVLKIRLDRLQNTCGTTECMILSGEILSRMSVEENPCVDFYNYTCSSFNQPEHRPPDKSEWNQFSVATQTILSRVRYLLSTNGSEYKGTQSTAVSKVKRFHSGCLNTSRADADGATNLLELIRALGSWPVTSDPTTGTWDATNWSLQEALYWTQSRGFNPFFSMGVENDLRNSSLNMIAVDQSGLLLYSEKLYTGEDVDKFRAAYINYFKDVAGLLGAESTTRQAEELWELERALAGAFVPKEDLVEVESTYNVVTLGDLQALISSGHGSVPLDMLDLTRRFIHPSVTSSTKIIVTVPEYFRKLGFILQAARPSTLASYVVWVAVRSMTQHAGSGFERARLRFTSTLTGVSEQSPHWERCVAATVDVMGFATGALYVERYFTGLDKQSVQKLISTIIEEYSEQLKGMEWMDETTRRRAREKAKAIESKVGYPEFIKDPVQLDKYYGELDITDDTFSNVLAFRIFDTRRNARKYGQPPDRREWLDYPTEVNAYYSRSTNQIIIPAGILQKPFYDKTFPMSLLFGSIGFIVGHELTHGFDNNGRKFDGQGNLADWWSERASNSFRERSQCFRKQYDKFIANGLNLNGLITLGENIADNGGAKLSLAAYKRWVSKPLQHSDMRGDGEAVARGDPLLPGLNMTRQQQFFVGFAQVWCSIATEEKIRKDILTNPHSIKRFRVNGVVRNVPDFSQAFKCSSESAIKSEDTCILW